MIINAEENLCRAVCFFLFYLAICDEVTVDQNKISLLALMAPNYAT